MFLVDGIDDPCEIWGDWVYAESHRRYLSIHLHSITRPPTIDHLTPSSSDMNQTTQDRIHVVPAQPGRGPQVRRPVPRRQGLPVITAAGPVRALERAHPGRVGRGARELQARRQASPLAADLRGSGRSSAAAPRLGARSPARRLVRRLRPAGPPALVGHDDGVSRRARSRAGRLSRERERDARRFRANTARLRDASDCTRGGCG